MYQLTKYVFQRSTRQPMGFCNSDVGEVSRETGLASTRRIVVVTLHRDPAAVNLPLQEYALTRINVTGNDRWINTRLCRLNVWRYTAHGSIEIYPRKHVHTSLMKLSTEETYFKPEYTCINYTFLRITVYFDFDTWNSSWRNLNRSRVVSKSIENFKNLDGCLSIER